MTTSSIVKLKLLTGLALQEVGVTEVGGDNKGPRVEEYQKVIGDAHGESWCCSFVQWCLRQTDLKYKSLYREESSNHLLALTENTQDLVTKSPMICQLAKPEPGCIVVWTYFKGEAATHLGHCGIVKEIVDNDYMLVIEGNTGPGLAIERQGDGVYLKKRRIISSSGPLRTKTFLLPWI